MKNKIFVSIIISVVLIVLFFISRPFLQKNNLLPFFLNSDGWNTVERQINSDDFKIIAFGNEPGWNIQINGGDFNGKEFNSNLILDYGDTTWSGLLYKTYQGSYETEFQFRGDVKQIVNNKFIENNKNIIVYFKKEECHDDADKSHSISVELNINGERILKGCADILYKNN